MRTHLFAVQPIYFNSLQSLSPVNFSFLFSSFPIFLSLHFHPCAFILSLCLFVFPLSFPSLFTTLPPFSVNIPRLDCKRHDGKLCSGFLLISQQQATHPHSCPSTREACFLPWLVFSSVSKLREILVCYSLANHSFLLSLHGPQRVQRQPAHTSPSSTRTSTKTKQNYLLFRGKPHSCHGVSHFRHPKFLPSLDEGLFSLSEGSMP